MPPTTPQDSTSPTNALPPHLAREHAVARPTVRPLGSLPPRAPSDLALLFVGPRLRGWCSVWRSTAPRYPVLCPVHGADAVDRLVQRTCGEPGAELVVDGLQITASDARAALGNGAMADALMGIFGFNRVAP